MKQLQVKTIALVEDKIEVNLTDGKNSIDYRFLKADFDEWITDGTGFVDSPMCHFEDNVITEVPIRISIGEYWAGLEINDSPQKEHVAMYLKTNTGLQSSLKAELLEEGLKQLFANLEPHQRAEAYASLLEYGMLKKEYGEQNASIIFKKILQGKAA